MMKPEKASLLFLLTIFCVAIYFHINILFNKNVIQKLKQINLELSLVKTVNFNNCLGLELYFAKLLYNKQIRKDKR